MQNQPLTKPLLLSSPDSKTLSALEKWTPTDPAPADKSELSKAIAALENQMKPAADREYAQAIVRLIEFAAGFQIPCPKPDVVHAIYRDMLKNLPSDLLSLAIDRIKADWIWGNRMPFPADILNKVKADLSRRAMLLARAKVAHLKATAPIVEKPALTPAQMQRAQARIQQIASQKCRPFLSEDPEESPEAAERQLQKDRIEFEKKYGAEDYLRA